MKKKLPGRIIAGAMIVVMAFGITACGREQTTVAETPALTASAPATEKTVEKETETEQPKETEAAATEKETEKATETEVATEVKTETEKEAAVTDGSPLVGEWTLEMFVFKFNDDGTGDYIIAGTSMPFTYEDHGDSVYVKFDGDDGGEEHGYRIDGDTLYFEDSTGEEVPYTR